jgi:hypothetical protein
MNIRRKQRLGKSLKTIGMTLDRNDYAGFKISEMQITPGMQLALQLIAKIKEYYDFRDVVQTIEKIAEKRENQASVASILTSIELLQRAAKNFDYGTNAYITVNEVAYKFAGFYLVLATSKQMGLAQEGLDDIVDAARNMLLLSKTGNPSEKSKTSIYRALGRDLTSIVYHFLALDLKEPDVANKLKVLLFIDEFIVERFIAGFVEATGINLAEKRWIKEDIVVSHNLPNKL